MGSASFKKFAVLSAVIALVGGALHAWPCFGAPISQRALYAASRGIASLQNLDGYGPPSWMDALAARLWRAGGATALAWGECLAVLTWWTLVGFVILLAVSAALRWVKTPWSRGVAFAIASVLLLGTAAPAAKRRAIRGNPPQEIRLIAASELAGAARAYSGNELFANPITLSQFLLFAPDAVGRLTPQQTAALSLNPPAWRKVLRETGWKAVALSGPVGEFRPLLDHLLTSPDWRLSLVTNHGYLFLREPENAVKPIDPATFRLGSDQETAIYLAQIAERYDAIRRPADAVKCLDAALDLAPENVTVLSHAATFAAGRKRWQDALTYSARALAQDPGSAHAKLVRSLALLETGEAQKAQNLCDEVLTEAPNDPYSLFLYARICRTLNDYAQESSTLERLVALTEKSGLSTVNYRIYLGQAYARQGQPEPALKNYRLVLESGLLPPDQADEIRDAISAIEQNAPKE